MDDFIPNVWFIALAVLMWWAVHLYNRRKRK